MLISLMGHFMDLGDEGLNSGGEELDLGWNIWSGSIKWFNMFPNDGDVQTRCSIQKPFRSSRID